MKVKILNILIVLHRNKSSNSSRRIKTFAKLPGITLLTELSLKVTSRKVDPYSHCIIITVSKAGSYIFPQSINTNHQLRFIMYLFRKVGNEKRFAILQNSRIRLHKNHRLRIYLCMSQFFVMLGVVHSYCNNLHYFSLKFNRLNITAK